MENLSLEEKLGLAVMRFAYIQNPPAGVMMKTFPSRNPNELVFQIIISNGEHFMASIKREIDGRLIPPVYTKYSTPSKKLYNEFCTFLDEQGFNIPYHNKFG